MRTPLLLASALVAFAALGAHRADAALLINEINFNPPGADSGNEYLEFRNTDATPLTIAPGTYFVAVEGDAGAATGAGVGKLQTIFNLSGLIVPANGFLVLAQGGSPYVIDAAATKVVGTGTGFTGVAGFLSESGSDIENESVSFLLINTATPPVIANDIDSDNNGMADGTAFATWTVLDSVALLDEGAADKTYAALTFAKTGSGVIGSAGVTQIPFDASYLARAGNSTGSAATDWIVAEILGTPPASALSTLGTPPRTIPVALAGLPLDHVGRANFLNDAPVTTISTPAITLDEDGSQTFNAAAGQTITIADSDALANAEKLTLAATSGTVTLATTTGLTVAAGANGTSTVTVTGPLAAINTALDGLVYAAGSNFSGTATLTVAIDDQGSTGVGGAQTDSDAITFTVAPVNDAPSFAVPGMQAVLMNGTLAFSAAGMTAITVADPDLGMNPIAVTATVSAGTLAATAAGVAVVTGTGTATLGITGPLADVNTTLDSLVFTAPATPQTVTLGLSGADNGSTGAGGPKTGTAMVQIAVTGAPMFAAPAGPFMFSTPIGGHSAVQTITLTAANLTGPIMATTMAPFELAAAAGGPFATTVTLTSTNGPLYVRYSPTATTTGSTQTATITYVSPGVTTTASTMLTGTVFRITTTMLPSATAGMAYTASVMAEGGVGAVTFTLMNPPAWLSITSAGVLSGTPPTDSDPTVTVIATDSQNPAQTTSAALPLTVNSAPAPDAGVPDAPADDAGVADGAVDAAPRPDAGTGTPTDNDDDGCCGTSHPAGSSLLGLVVLGLLVGGSRRRGARRKP